MESTVKKALIKFYGDKYDKLGKDEKEKKIEGHLKAILPSELAGDISGSEMTKMGYSMGENKIYDKIDNGGYRLVYDSFSEGLEPIYFWFVDWMRDTYWGGSYEIDKTMDRFEASVGSGFFGDMGTRGSIMQDRAMKMMTTINAVTRSVINLLYDLKEFEQRLELYRDVNSDDKEKVNNARLALKQFWMDKVDVQRGRASINMLSQQLQFVTLRDAFMAATTPEDVMKSFKEGGMDVNDRVKRILGPRVSDYLTWERLSAKELERRYKIERNYLKSQVESLKLYAQWAKPYFQASESLHSEVSGSADLVSTFNTMQLKTSLLGTKREGSFLSAVEVSFNFRTIPHTMRQSQAGVHYTQGGRVEIQVRGFGLNEEERKAIGAYQFHEGLQMAKINEELIKEIEESVRDHLDGEEKEFEDPVERLGFLQELVEREADKDIRKEIIKDIEKLKKEIKEEKKGPNPFGALLDVFKEFPGLKKVEKNEGSRGGALKRASGDAYLIYNVFKKGHGMFTE